MFIGAILVVVGVLLLLQIGGFLSSIVWAYFWPALLIVVGLWFMFRHKHHGCGACMWCKKHHHLCDDCKKHCEACANKKEEKEE